MDPEEELPVRADLVAAIPADWRAAVDEVAGGLVRAGKQAWVVGGTVRDLLRGEVPKDVDLVTDALPDEVEALFPRTVAVGKSFGVVVVVCAGKEVEVATFREERGYSDRRRPDEVVYAREAALDARRRDFTCNAIFLDPLDGRLLDPTGGVADLRARVLRTVGDPRDRFREDGLRLLRMARFLGAFHLDPAPGLLAAARAEGASLGGVSPERVLDEVLKVLAGEGVHRAFSILEECGLLTRCLPGWGNAEERLRMLEWLELESPGGLAVEPALALLLGGPFGDVEEPLRALRASNALRESVVAAVLRARDLAELAGDRDPHDLDPEEVGEVVELLRHPSTGAGSVLMDLVERLMGDDAAARRGEELAPFWDLEDEAPADPVELAAADLLDLGIPRGPALGEGLRRVRRASLGGAFTDRDGALAWARAHLVR